MTHATICDDCEFREETADYVAATLVRDDHEGKTGHTARVLPVTFNEAGKEPATDGGEKYEWW